MENKFVNRKLEKRGVISPCHERLCYVHVVQGQCIQIGQRIRDSHIYNRNVFDSN
jgi:hypothetical protein